MKNIRAIAHKMVLEAIRMRILVLVFLFITVLIAILPFILKSDGSLKGHIQITLEYSFTLMAFFIYIMSLFLSTYSFSLEIKNKYFYLIDTKPVKRWEFILGKFIGILILNLSLLILFSSITLGLIYYIYSNSLDLAGKKQTRKEILTASRGVLPHRDLRAINRLANERYANLKDQGKLPKDKTELEIKNKIVSILMHSRNIVNYRESKEWLFTDIPIELSKQKELDLKIRYKFFSEKYTAGLMCKVKWIIGRGKNAFSFEDEIRKGEFNEFTIPSYVIEDDGTVLVKFKHDYAPAGMIYFPLNEGVELFYPIRPFIVNYLEAVFLIFTISAFIVSVAILGSTFLTFPVASLMGLYMLVVGLLGSYLLESVTSGTRMLFENNVDLMTKLSQIFMYGIFTIIPNFSHYVPFDYVSIGRVIEWSLIFESIFKVFIFRVGIIILLSFYIFNRREVGKPFI